MASPIVDVVTWGPFAATATAQTMLTYSGPGGSFPTSMQIVLWIDIVFRDSTNSLSDSVTVRAIAHNNGGTLTVVDAGTVVAAKKGTSPIGTSGAQILAQTGNLLIQTSMGQATSGNIWGMMRAIVGS